MSVNANRQLVIKLREEDTTTAQRLPPSHIVVLISIPDGRKKALHSN